MRTAVGSFIGAALVVACCAGLPLIAGALGAVALGALFGVGAPVLAGALFVVALSAQRPRRARPLGSETE
jgi:hypothetical protein